MMWDAMSEGSDGDAYWGRYDGDASSPAWASMDADCWSGVHTGSYLPDDRALPVLRAFQPLPKQGLHSPHGNAGGRSATAIVTPSTGMSSQAGAHEQWCRQTLCSTAPFQAAVAWQAVGTEFATNLIDEPCSPGRKAERPSALWSRRSQRHGGDRELVVATQGLSAAGPAAVRVPNEYWESVEAPRKLAAKRRTGGPRRHRPWEGFNAGVAAVSCGSELLGAAFPLDIAKAGRPLDSPVHSDDGSATPKGYWSNVAWDPDERVYVGHACGTASVSAFEYMDWDV